MARKAVWDDDTISSELAQCYNDLEGVPVRHLKRLTRLLSLYELSERYTLVDKLARQDATYVHGYSTGVVMTVKALRLVMEQVIDGTFEAIREEDSEHGSEPRYVERDWDERFGE